MSRSRVAHPDLSERYQIYHSSPLVCEIHGDNPGTLWTPPRLYYPFAICSSDPDAVMSHVQEWNTSPALWDIPLREYLKMLGLIAHPDPYIEESIADMPDFDSDECGCGYKASSRSEFEALARPDDSTSTSRYGLIQYRVCPNCGGSIRGLTVIR